MKIINEEDAVPNDMSAMMIPIGSVFTGKIGQHKGTFLRTFDGVVHLEEPNNTWGPDVRTHNVVFHDATLHIRSLIEG